MKKLDYTATALEPFHSGSSEKMGNHRALRRESILLDKPIKLSSKFKSMREKRIAAVNVLYYIWKSIDWDNVKSQRLMTIYDEFTSKLLASATVQNKQEFINKYCERLGIVSLSNPEIIRTLEKFYDEEFLQLIRNEYQYLVLLLRARIESEKEKKKSKGNFLEISLFDEFVQKEETDEEISNAEFVQFSAEVPMGSSGNQVRAIMRRIGIRDFCKLTGVDIIEKSMYHRLMTGGVLDESHDFEDIDVREELVKMCPVIGVLGAAIGNMTIEGCLKVSDMRPICKEHGTGNISFWQMLDIVFATRDDTSKKENDIMIYEIPGKPYGISQMFYTYEVFCKGTKFQHSFRLVSDDKLMIGVFYRLLILLKNWQYVGGKSAVGRGKLDFAYSVNPDNEKFYLDYLEQNKEKIVKFFEVEKYRKLLAANYEE